ncbi:OmpA family protein [Acrocarpospora macrocephala]|uniref:OmpA-like domain-containing protein n=1 Tax=Acrocarpospora macrocephala TaxID=150177 RepID=A0A5M3XB94_9ACTN|nr:OmpA family protein [Acrocarpospora macrocephala]GES15308.1 hypothetical protein Amac_089050 [Acrocarpospora macrocephala]
MKTPHPRKVTGLLAVAAVSMAATGCTESVASPNPDGYQCAYNYNAPVALVIGARANSPEPQLPAKAHELVSAAADNGQLVTIVRIDGNPRIVFQKQLKHTAQNNQGRRDESNRFLGEIRLVLRGTPPSPWLPVGAVQPEADVLSAFRLGVRAVPAKGTVIVVDSGVQTVAPLNFQGDGMLTVEPADLVDYVKQIKLLPDAKGRQVLFSGLGDTALPQAKLEAYRANIVALWRGIAKAGGACVDVDSQATTQDARTGVPSVSVVNPPPPPPPPTQPPPCSTVDLADNNNVGFLPNQDVFRNPRGARATLKELAAALLSDPRQHLRLTGTSANFGTEAGRIQLSNDRAKAVENALVNDMGVPRERISSTGVGTHFPGFKEDHGPNGEMLSAAAEQNRKVIAELVCEP